MGHRHQEPEGEALLLAARSTLEASGEQWTAMRESVFAALSRFAKPASAYDIAEAVSLAQGRRIAANSIYRILDLFVRTNLARRVESINAYIANSHPGCVHDCIFLVCDSCGNATHIDDDGLSRSVRRTAESAGYVDIRPVIEVRGRCAACD